MISCLKNYKTIFIFFTFVLTLSYLLWTSVELIKADTVTTEVTVGNTAPSFTDGPRENPTSDNTTPTDVGSDVTFEATASDSNSENYYLIVCTTNAVTANNGGAPTCDVGTWCTSTATASTSQATCSYTVQASDTLETYDWYAFVCDGNSSNALCSSVDQGSGNSGSPFSVNHPPTFNAISNDSPKNPGQDITWSTDASTLDTDSAGTADTVKLVVCKTAGVSAGDCDGGASDRWCQSSLVANNPSCAYSIPIPTASGNYDAYVYLFDSHNLGSSDANQGTNENYSVNNITPVVSNVIINGGSDIDLTEGTTLGVTVTADVTDNNGCSELTSVTSSLYRSGVGYSACDTGGEEDYDSCYPIKSCSEVSCTGAGASYTCTIDMQYHSDPTDTDTQYPSENWLSTVAATDPAPSTGTFESAAGVQVNSLTALDVTSAINYGNLDVGPNTGNLDQTTTTTATGNVGIDENLSGTDMDDGGSGTILVTYQKYGLSAILYSSATSLTGSATELEINVPKTYATGTSQTPGTNDTYWGIEIPAGTTSGIYTGTNTVEAVKGEVVGW